MNGSRHKIQQQHVAVHFEGLADASGIQNEIAVLFNEDLLPKMETLFDEVAGGKYAISIDSLEIDCGTLPLKNWKRLLVDEALRRIKTELVAAQKKDFQQTRADNLLKSFLFFVETGCLPWNSDLTTVKELEKVALTDSLMSNLKDLLKNEMQAAERLANWFSTDFIDSLLNLLTKNKPGELSSIYDLLSKYKMPADVDVKVSLLRALASNGNNVQLFFSYLHQKVNSADKRLINEIAETEKLSTLITDLMIKRKKDNSEPAIIYVNNAGLVILHPFLPILFKRLGLLKDDVWKDTASQHEACFITQFLVTGSDRQPEFELPLNKIMCGLNSTDVLPPSQELSASVKEQCESLLDAVIANWTVLKNTSREGLRETFLQRSGKLTPVDNGWQLKVEQKGFDVLLGRLPWGIGVIKHSWMEKILFVEWV